MFCITNLISTKRLSLVLGVIAGFYRLYTFEQHIGPHLKEPAYPWYILWVKIGHLEVDFAASFILVWMMVRFLGALMN